MTLLNERQKQLVFDYCIGLTSENQSIEAEKLIAQSQHAASLHSKLKASFAPLDLVEEHTCPDELAERTIFRLNNAARSSRLQLEQLLAAEQAKTGPATKRLWWNLTEIIAAAAVILFVSGVIIAPLKRARHNCWQQSCKNQLSRIAQGLANYRADHDNTMPTIAASTGQPWWKVGYQGKENHSNTRNMWLLAKNGYVDLDDFVCPGKRQGRAIQFDQAKAAEYNDFPARRYITYSFRIRPSKAQPANPHNTKVLIADLNPLFEKLPKNFTNSFKLKIDGQLINLNSGNHNRQGQNILLSDSSVKFITTRCFDIANDDIFTLQNTSLYKGTETPLTETDAFLAP